MFQTRRGMEKIILWLTTIFIIIFLVVSLINLLLNEEKFFRYYYWLFLEFIEVFPVDLMSFYWFYQSNRFLSVSPYLKLISTNGNN